MGVRTNVASAGSRLRRALARYVDDSLEVPPNFSLQLAEKAGDFHFLYWGRCAVSRTLDTERILRSLLTFLAAHGHAGPGVLKVRTLALVRNGRAVLCPPGLKGSLTGLEPMLVRRGFAVVDGPWALVDVARAELLVAGIGLDIDRAPLDEIVATAPKGRFSPSVPSGRYPLAAWAFADPDSTTDGPVGRAQATVRALSLMPPEMSPPPDLVASMGELFAHVPARTLPMKVPQALVDALDALANGP